MSARIALTALFVGMVACHRPVNELPSPVATVEHYCWWSAQPSLVTPDVLIARFRRGFTNAHLTHPTQGQGGDTTLVDRESGSLVNVAHYSWVRAGPTRLGGEPLGAKYEFWAMTYVERDTTRFRTRVAILSPRADWMDPSDTVKAKDRVLPLCGAVYQALR
jgi:hypothetical protein